MNTILLQKILDILRECLAHAGNFFKDLFVSDPQDGQVIGYDGDTGKWKNMNIAELTLDVTDTAGPDDIITFTDAAAMPLKSLVADIDIEGGTNAVVITRTGKNLANGTFVQGAISSTDGTVASSNIRCSSDFIPVCAGQTYTGSIASGQKIVRFNQYDKNKGFISGNIAPSSFTVASGTAFVRAIVGFSNDGNIAPSDVSNFQLENGNTATAFESYTATSETVTLPSSVANGYVDVISGEGMDDDTTTTFSVTPVIIRSTTGVNNIFADSGSVTAEYYTKTAGDIKNMVSISEDITDQVTVNTDNFSDVHVKVMKNNNVITIYLNSATAILGGQLLTGLPAPAYNMNIVVNDGSDGSPVGATLQTQGRLNVSAAAAQTVNALITYVAK